MNDVLIKILCSKLNCDRFQLSTLNVLNENVLEIVMANPDFNDTYEDIMNGINLYMTEHLQKLFKCKKIYYDDIQIQYSNINEDNHFQYGLVLYIENPILIEMYNTLGYEYSFKDYILRTMFDDAKLQDITIVDYSND